MYIYVTYVLSFFLDFIYFVFRERGREGEREGEKHPCVVASEAPPTADLAHNPGMCPDRSQTGNPSVCRPALNPLSHTSRDYFYIYIYMDMYSLSTRQVKAIRNNN